MAVTLREVAELAGVSCATASLALNGKEVNENTRQRVFLAARTLNYQRNELARNLITGRSNTIGLYVLGDKTDADLTGGFSYYRLIRGVNDEIGGAGYALHFEVCDRDDDAMEFLSGKLRSRRVDGMLVIPQYVTHSYDFAVALERERFPFVVLNPASPIRGHRNVTVDNYTGMYRVCEFIARRGALRVGFINGAAGHYDTVTRGGSFLDNVDRFDLTLAGGRVFFGHFTVDGGREACEEMLSCCSPEVIVCANDYMAAGVLQSLSSRGIRAGVDIGVIGYEDADVAAALTPRLTTVHFSMYDVGRMAAKRLIDLLADPEKGESNVQLLIEPRLVIRESCV